MATSTVRFLTPEWAAALESAGGRSGSMAEATRDVHFTLQHEVVDDDRAGAAAAADPPEATVRFALVFDHGRFEVVWGGVDDADVTFVLDRRTAEQLGRGDLNAQRAFVLGKLRVRGDIDRLVGAREAFLAVDDVFRDVRERTEW